MDDMQFDRTVEIEIAGETRKVLLCLWGLTLAEEKGFDVSGIDLDEEDAQERQGDLGQMLDMLWIGMLPFNEDLTRRGLGMHIGFDDLPKLEDAFNKIVSRQLTEDIREKVEEAQTGGEAEGKE